jgi:hypothetical protein
MKLNDLLNGEFTAWEEIFIEHKEENGSTESMTNYIDLDSYDDSRNGDIINQNDSRVIKQYDKKYGQDEYIGFDWNRNDPDEEDDIPEISRGNDARVIDEYLNIYDYRRCMGCCKAYSDCCMEDCKPVYAIELNNDIKVMLDYDEDLFELYYWKLYVNYQYCRYMFDCGLSFTLANRLLKITKIKNIVNGKKFL